MSKPRSLVRAARKNFATVAHHHPLPPAPIWDTFVYQPIGPIDTESRASPIATSSRVTLDHLLIRPSAQLPTTSIPRAIVQKAQEVLSDWTGAGEALAFATDEELVHALLLPLTSRGDGAMKIGEYDWHRTLYPALAFHALRSRGSYAAFLRAVRPYVRSLYPRLRAAKVHQLFVSDLLLRHPDPVILRDLLKINGELVIGRSSAGKSEPGASEKLRSSLIRSMYTIIQPADRARFPLTAAVNLSICRAMVETQDWEGLERAWMDLYDTADLSPESSYHLLQLLIKLEPHRRERAMGLFSTMVTTGKSRLPMGVLSRVDDQHPQTGQLLLRSALIRACCRWKLYQRAQSAVEVLLDVAVQGASAQGSQAVTDALSLTRQVCRVSLASAQREDLDWVGGMLSKMARMKQDAQTARLTPRVPGRLLDLYVAARASIGGKQEVRDIYTIQSTARGRLSTHSLLHIAEAGGDEATLLKIGAEMLDHSAETIASVAAPFIRALLAPLPPDADLSEAQAGAALGLSAKVNFAQPSFTLCQHAVAVYLASSLSLSTAALVHIAKRLRPHKQLAQVLLEEQERRLQASIDNVEQGSTIVKRLGKRIANSDRLGMAEAYLSHGLRAMARRQLAGLDFDDATLTTDIVNTLLRTPEIKRDMERMLGPDGMDMGWVIPQL